MSAVWAQILSAALGVASTVAVRLIEDALKRRAARRGTNPPLVGQPPSVSTVDET